MTKRCFDSTWRIPYEPMPQGTAHRLPAQVSVIGRLSHGLAGQGVAGWRDPATPSRPLGHLTTRWLDRSPCG